MQNVDDLQYKSQTRDGRDITVRRVGLKEYELFISLGFSYDGFDNLPTLYKPLVVSGMSLMFMAYVDDKPVRFELKHIYMSYSIITNTEANYKF